MQYRKTAIALLTAAATVVAAASPASAAWRGHGWGGHHGGWGGHHRGWGWGGAGIGFATGALIGSALASPGYGYGYGYGYGGPYAYGGYVDDEVYAAAPVYGGGRNDDAYCSQRFRSYDPSSGTYMGYDGQRHPCP